MRSFQEISIDRRTNLITIEMPIDLQKRLQALADEQFFTLSEQVCICLGTFFDCYDHPCPIGREAL